MHYNLKLEVERVNNQVVSQLEIAGVGRADRKRIVTDDFDSALKAIKSAHDEMLDGVMAYHRRGEAAQTSEAQASEQQVAQTEKSGTGGKGGKGKGKGKPKAAKPAPKGDKAGTKPKAQAKTKAPARKFAEA